MPPISDTPLLIGAYVHVHVKVNGKENYKCIYNHHIASAALMLTYNRENPKAHRLTILIYVVKGCCYPPKQQLSERKDCGNTCRQAIQQNSQAYKVQYSLPSA